MKQARLSAKIIPVKTDIINGLNENQRDAVEYAQGPSIILAGAGSGKTRVLTHKVFNLIKNHDVNPGSIMMVTFTNKAAHEMKQRVGREIGFIGTFHSFCVRVLRQYYRNELLPDFVIYDQDDQEAVIKDCIAKNSAYKKYSPSMVMYKISHAKNHLVDYKNYAVHFHDYSSQVIAELYKDYQDTLVKNNALDFDDLITNTVFLFKKNKHILQEYQNRYKYILVDEFQDTNHAQYILTKLLSHLYQNITVVGDFSQGIYSWRGAKISNLETFRKDFPTTRTFYLEQNYRSTQNILDFAFGVISKNTSHPILKLFTKNNQGEDVSIHEVENEEYEAIFLASEVERINTEYNTDYSKIAILYRINAQSRVIEEAFLHTGIPYVLIGGTRFYERKEIKDIMSYMRLMVSRQDEVALKRVLKIGKKRYDAFSTLYEELGDTLKHMTTNDVIDAILQRTKYTDLYDEHEAEDAARLENIRELRSVALNFPNIHDFLEQVALVESEYFQNEKRKKHTSGVQMMTLHQAKGLEFSFVFIVGVEEGILPHSRSLYDTESLEEERRLFYVGITRAEKKLYITHAQRRFLFGRRSYAQASRFIDDSAEYF